MVRDIEQLLVHTTLRIEGIDHNGKSFTGTGFLYGHKVGNGFTLPLLVSNKHVLRVDAQQIRARVLGRDDDGEPDYSQAILINFEFDEISIVGHPNPDIDVAALTLNTTLIDVPAFYQSLGEHHLVPADQEAAGLLQRAFESIMFIGYPDGLYDVKNTLPLARFGHLSTQIDLDYWGLPAFLIDASVFPGSSGSPVFVYRRFQRSSGGQLTWGEEPFFAGVLASVHVTHDVAEIAPISFGAIVKKELGLGLVYRAETVVELAELIAGNARQEPT